MSKPTPEQEPKASGTGAALGYGTNFAAGMAVFAGLGWYIDHRRGEDGQGFSLAGIFLGLFYGGYELWKLVRVLQREAEKKDGP